MSFHRIKPILFNTEMVRAILAGRKTVTRRLPSKRIEDKWYEYDEYVSAVMPHDVPCVRYNEKAFYEQYPPYQIGDILYVRETWAKIPSASSNGGFAYKYKASKEGDYWNKVKGFTWHPSIHMPKEAARIWLKVTDVRVERLQDMTEDDVCYEGAENLIYSCEHIDYSVVPPEPCFNTCNACKDCIIDHSYQELFGRQIWDSTIKKNDLDRYGWDANPWVWVIEFERIER